MWFHVKLHMWKNFTCDFMWIFTCDRIHMWFDVDLHMWKNFTCDYALYSHVKICKFDHLILFNVFIIDYYYYLLFTNFYRGWIRFFMQYITYCYYAMCVRSLFYKYTYFINVIYIYRLSEKKPIGVCFNIIQNLYQVWPNSSQFYSIKKRLTWISVYSTWPFIQYYARYTFWSKVRFEN